MKKSIYSLILLFSFSISFGNVNFNYSSKEIVKKNQEDILTYTCVVRMVNSSGQTLGYINFYDVPDNVPCGGSQIRKMALEIWDAGH